MRFFNAAVMALCLAGVSLAQSYEVTATREGLVGGLTSTGKTIEANDVFVALPHRKVRGRTVEVTYKGKSVVCKVEDTGPHSIGDAYWEKGTRPAAESGIRIPNKWGKALNPAGIDLSDGLWAALGIPRKVGMVKVTWRFVD